jgi:hypothetical protein
MTTAQAQVTAASATLTTEDLPFSAYLHATRKLRFLSCHSTANGRMQFVFADPKHEGDQLHIEFETGAECSAVAFYDSIRHLRRVMDRTRTRSIEPHEQHSHRR